MKFRILTALLSASLIFSNTLAYPATVHAGTVKEEVFNVSYNDIYEAPYEVCEIEEMQPEIIDEEVVEAVIEPVIEPVPVELVGIDIPTYTVAKTYEDGGLITDRTSLAYQELSKCYINYQGHYIYEDGNGEIYYSVAMGNYFDDVGSKYKVSLDNGNTFNIIKCDVKQDRHTTNRMIDSAGAIIEFIIDTDTASQFYGVGANGYILNGSFNNTDQFNGAVVQIEQYKE